MGGEENGKGEAVKKNEVRRGGEHDALAGGRQPGWLGDTPWSCAFCPLHCCGLFLTSPPTLPASHLSLPLLLPAVYYRGPRPRASVDVVSDSSHKLDQRLGGLWDSVVWPYCVVKVTDESVCVQLFLLQEWRADSERDH